MSQVVQLGDPLLRQSTQLIDDPLSPKTKAMIDQMVMTLKKEKGIGIAGPQVGFDQQIFIVAPNQVIKAPYTNLETGLVVMNPKISFLTDDITYEWEGCLSIPGIRGYVPRKCNIMIEYMDAAGQDRSEVYSEFIARIFLHEYDHLIGTLFIDLVDDLKTQLITDAYYMQLMEDEE